MEIGVIGLGGIAQKAYLPVMAQMQDEIEWILCTRNASKGEALKEKYGFAHFTTDIQALIDRKVTACFVHTPTPTHYAIVKQLLQNGISVFVDKPLSENVAEVKELTRYATENSLILMSGFNRRSAPFVQKLKAISGKNLILVQKNRINQPQEYQEALYDLFIHPLDTALYLLEAEIQEVRSHLVVAQGRLQRASLQLETASTTAIVSMNLCAGANREQIEVMATSGTYIVEDLATFKEIQKDRLTEQAFGDWEPTLEKRGFAPMIRSFIQLVKDSSETTSFVQEKAMLSHDLCAQMIRRYRTQTDTKM